MKLTAGVIAMIFAALMASVCAFITPGATLTGFGRPATTGARTTSAGSRGMLMACRQNSKKEKRQRNRENMRKFNKKGISRKKIVRIQSQERAAEDEANFLANLFQSGMDDWEVVDIFNEP